jgi:hypothetical protein
MYEPFRSRSSPSATKRKGALPRLGAGAQEALFNAALGEIVVAPPPAPQTPQCLTGAWAEPCAVTERSIRSRSRTPERRSSAFSLSIGGA